MGRAGEGGENLEYVVSVLDYDFKKHGILQYFQRTNGEPIPKTLLLVRIEKTCWEIVAFQ